VKAAKRSLKECAKKLLQLILIYSKLPVAKGHLLLPKKKGREL
jgi:hypothetical protein